MSTLTKTNNVFSTFLVLSPLGDSKFRVKDLNGSSPLENLGTVFIDGGDAIYISSKDADLNHKGIVRALERYRFTRPNLNGEEFELLFRY